MPIDLAGAVAAWLVGVFGDAGIALVRGSADERELKKAVRKAIETVVDRADPASREALRRALGQCFSYPQLIRVEGSSSVVDGLRAAIVAQVGQLAEWVRTDTGRSFYEDVAVSPDWVAEQVTNAFIAALRQYAAGGGLAELVHGLDTAEIMARLDALGLQISGLAVGAPSAAAHTLPTDVASFTGRAAEMEQLICALTDGTGTGGLVRIDAIDGMAGIGKTAFAVHAAHQLASRFPDGQLFVRLHAHTPGQRPTEPADALATLLLTIGVAPQQIPAGLEAREGLWRDRMAGRKALVLLDDASGSDQVRPLLPGTAETLVLVTSRHRLAALPEALPVRLDILEAGEAAQLFARLAGRPGLLPSNDAVADVAALCGYLPLAISLMAGQLKHHPAWTAADLATELASANDRLAPMHAENDSVAVSFGLSYRNLSEGPQRLFRLLGLHPGSDIDAYAAAALDGAGLATVRRILDELFGYHLIEEPARGRYRFHDLIRQYARTLGAADPVAERDAAIDRLLDLYLHTARAADRHLARRTSAVVAVVTANPPAHAPDLPTREDALTWMDAERPNLQAAADYAALHERTGHAIAIPDAVHSFLRGQGYWDQALTLHRTALNAARHASDQLAEASALTDMGAVHHLTGDYQAASAGLTRALRLYRDGGDRLGEANALNELGAVQYLTGGYRKAIASLGGALELYRDCGDRLGEASALNNLGIGQQLTGDYQAAAASLTQALEIYRELGNRNGEANALNNLGIGQRLIDYRAAAASFTQALEIYRELGNRNGEANALNDLGIGQERTGDYRAATASLTQALHLYRDLGNRLGEAEVHNNIGSVQQLTGDFQAATASFTQALALFRDLGNRLGEAKVLNNMGELRQLGPRPARKLTMPGSAIVHRVRRSRRSL